MLKRIAIAITVATLGPMSAAAQTPCSYDECALRLEPGGWFGETVVRGKNSTKVGTLSPFGGPRLGRIVQAPDSARTYIATFDRNYTPGAIVATVGGIAATVAWLVAAANEGDDERRNWTIIAWTATGVSWYGGWRVVKARRALSRGIWWYNRDLPR